MRRLNRVLVGILFVIMRFLHRLAIYALITAIIEVPSILLLYGLGYPNSPSSDWVLPFLIVMNLYVIWILMHTVIGGAVPSQPSRDITFDPVWGVMSMFIIITIIGESIYWLTEEARKQRRT
jgi:hypothetical protein